MSPEQIEEIAALIVQGGMDALALFLKLEPLLNLGPDEKTNIAAAILAADNADKDTIAAVEAWEVRET